MEVYGRLGRANDIRRTNSAQEAALAEIEQSPIMKRQKFRTRLLNKLRQRPTPL
jgi:hypothetical protein